MNKSEIFNKIKELEDELAKFGAELKSPAVEFEKGEIVEFRDFGGQNWKVSEFSRYGCEPQIPYVDNNGLVYKQCRKIPSLPMNMTEFDGTNKPDNNKIVIVKHQSGMINADMVTNIRWNRVKEFQIIHFL